MIDLAKLEAKIDGLLENETDQSLLEWFQQYENEYFADYRVDLQNQLENLTGIVGTEDETEYYSELPAEKTSCQGNYRLAA